LGKGLIACFACTCCGRVPQQARCLRPQEGQQRIIEGLRV